MVWIRPEWFPFGSVRKLQARSAGSFQLLKRVGSNAYVIDILPNYGISSTFNREDLVAYRGQPVIPDGPFEDPLLDPATNSIPNCCKHIDAILDEHFVFTRYDEVQCFLVLGKHDQIHMAHGSPWTQCSSLILICWSTTRAARNYTQRGRFFPTPGELMGTSNTDHRSHVYGRRCRRMTQSMTLWLGD
ncbi:hypothetical protein SLA2020_268040 [Shorea laevis]